VKSKKKMLKEEIQKDYEVELSKIRLSNAQSRIDAQIREKAIFRPSTGFKIAEGGNDSSKNEKVNVKRIEED